MKMRNTIYSMLVFYGLIQNAYSSDIFKINGFASGYGNYGGWGNVYKERSVNNFDVKGNTKLGINLRVDPIEHISVISQIVSSGNNILSESQYSNWDLRTDWLFIQLTLNSHFKFKIGRLLYPAWMKSEFIEVGYALPWRMAPSQVYGISPFKSFEGIHLTYSQNLFGLAFQGTVFGGALHNNISSFQGETPRLRVVDGDSLLGLELMLSTVGFKFHAMVSRMNWQVTYYPKPIEAKAGMETTEVEIPTQIDYTVGVQIDKHNIFLLAETGTSNGKKGTKFYNPYIKETLTAGHKSYGSYVTTGYRFHERFLPHYTYAYAKLDNGFDNGEQTTHSIASNYTFNDHLVWKIGYDYDTSKKGNGAFVSAPGIARTIWTGIDVVF